MVKIRLATPVADELHLNACLPWSLMGPRSAFHELLTGYSSPQDNSGKKSVHLIAKNKLEIGEKEGSKMY
ncbi:MAG: hypothetical protein LBU32_15840 [Clostridiales bacterium]|jgi:hypothetical protein|nr:hypothetical protein [Clostridiales bacterium]